MSSYRWAPFEVDGIQYKDPRHLRLTRDYNDDEGVPGMTQYVRPLFELREEEDHECGHDACPLSQFEEGPEDLLSHQKPYVWLEGDPIVRFTSEGLQVDGQVLV